jgi:potassium-transporting ATPase ATP-binding subunit
MTPMTFDNPGAGGGASPLARGLSGGMLARALGDAFVKLNPARLLSNPVIFATWIVAAACSSSPSSTRARSPNFSADSNVSRIW